MESLAKSCVHVNFSCIRSNDKNVFKEVTIEVPHLILSFELGLKGGPVV